MSINNTPDMQAQIAGGLWKISSCLCFALINTIVRYLSCGTECSPDVALPNYVIIFFQNLFGTVFMLPVIWKMGTKGLYTTRPLLHTLRVVISAVGIGLWYAGLYYLPMAQAVALSFTGPIFTVIGANLFLKERIDFKRGLAIFICFSGAFIILRPDEALWGTQGSEHGLAVFFPLGAALTFAASKLLSRVLASSGESAEAMTFYLLVLMVPVTFLPAVYDWVTPTMEHLPWLFAMGALAGGAHYTLTRSLAVAEVSFVMPFGYSKILISAALGYLVFDETPKSWTMWLGSLIIFASLILLTTPKQAFTRQLKGA